jgi:hypothetical protein
MVNHKELKLWKSKPQRRRDYWRNCKAIAGEVFQKDGEVSLDTEADR